MTVPCTGSQFTSHTRPWLRSEWGCRRSMTRRTQQGGRGQSRVWGVSHAKRFEAFQWLCSANRVQPALAGIPKGPNTFGTWRVTEPYASAIRTVYAARIRDIGRRSRNWRVSCLEYWIVEMQHN